MSTRVALAALAAIGAALHLTGLGRVPIHLHHDEIYFGLIADSVAQSLRDPHGRLLPLLFQMGDSPNWYPPIHIYVTALWLRITGVSDVMVRMPNAILGVCDVVMMFFVARRVFASDRLGLAAAAMLAITPAHFINSRISTDCLYPVTFILLWMLLLLRYLEKPSTLRLAAATAVLGVGMYAYIASVIMMPIYLLLTLALLALERRGGRALIIAIAGFAITIVPGVAFAVAHPEIIGNYASKYELAGNGPQLNPFQMARDTLTPWNISDHLNQFHSSFSPGFLFVTGGSNLAHSTRTAGVFLAPMALLLAAGLIAVIRRPRPITLLILAGFLTAPIAATVVREEFAIPRMLGLLPFGVLIATLGAAALWAAPLTVSLRRAATVAAAICVATGGIYLLLMLARQAHLSWSAILMMVIGVATWWLGAKCDAQRSWQPVVIAALALMPLQFAWFAADYFGDYRARSAARYEYNIRGAFEQAIAIRDRMNGPCIYLNDDILFVRGFWDYYVRVFKRPELLSAARAFNSENGLPADAPSGSVIVSDVNDRAMQRLQSDPALVKVGEATDPVPGSDPPSQHTTLVIFQKR